MDAARFPSAIPAAVIVQPMRTFASLAAAASVLLMGPAVTACAQDAQGGASAAEMAALDLPEALPQATPAQAGDGRAAGKWSVEAAIGHDQWRDWTFADTPPDSLRGRLSTQYSGRWPLSSRWQAVLTNRVDISYRNGQGGLHGEDVAYTMSEAYLAFGQQRLFVDAGRMNDRTGVAYAYNPTDVFRSNSVVARVSEDPSLLRSTRLGVLGVRAQYIYDDGSLTLIAAPGVRTRPSRGVLSPRLENTNSDTRVMLRASRRLSEQSLIEGVLAHQPGVGWQPGGNVSTLWGDHAVVYGEVLFTRERGIDARSDAWDPLAPYASLRDRTHYRPRAAAGVSVALGQRYTLVVEGHHDATALDAKRLRAMAQPEDPAALLRYLRLRQYASDSQSPLSRRYLFSRLAVARPFGENTSLAGFVRYNLEDDSSYLWLQTGFQRGAFAWSATIAAPLGRRATEYGDLQASTTFLLTMEWTR
ncbi:hypothetical protein [uncultured Stenotrophomonas sp.]|uniref:hypothetical protein n=1 Tax=uncultured Stenotrophomonas sp. TaxID=165438 RepID=UPI0025DBCB72|nr:hypothetical protein [uncultured Stenotrophomonas sp.]